MEDRGRQLTEDARSLGHTWVVYRTGSGLLLYSGENEGSAKDWLSRRWPDVKVLQVARDARFNVESREEE